MKLLYIQPHPEWGSAEEYVQTLIEGVKDTYPEWEISLLCPVQTHDQWHRQIGFAAEVIPSEKHLLAITKQIKNVGPDLVHLNHPDVKALAASRWARVPEIVVTDHSAPANISYNWKGTLLWQFAKRASNLHLIALAQANKKLLIEKYGFSEEQVEIIHHGLKLRRFNHIGDRAQFRAKLNIPEEAFVLICVARLSEEKAHEVLLEALREVKRSSSQAVYLLLAGDGARRPWLEHYVQELGLKDSVRFLGHRADVVDWLNAADVFVLSSNFEGLPFSLLEAMAVGKPIIATQVGGCAELVSDDIGILVPPREPQAFAKAILWALEQPGECRQKGEQAKFRFLQEYTSEKMIERTLQLYERLLGIRELDSRKVAQLEKVKSN